MPHSSRPSGSSQGERPRRGVAPSGSGASASAGGRGRPRQASLAGSPSGVRRQAGRRKGRANLWPRRIITGTGLLLVVGLILWALFNAVAWVFSDSDEAVAQSGAQSGAVEDSDSPRMTADGVLYPNDAVRIPECTPDMLALNSTTGSIHVGQALTASVEVSTQANTACSTDAGMFGLMITSGDEIYYDSRQCEADGLGSPLLLSPTASWSGELKWDGRRYAGCSPIDSDGDGATDLAQPGTYKVRVMYGDHNTSSEHIIEVGP
ncbi:hypothetical protein [Schaalia sp. Marseille-Q2122]|uniref:hypothetical protein n=1 Tax=Schaalia sp. Marseille-Q2122 TaxID=2736604 RepID=UPI00158BFCA4|nr:hypothetical protein [Schaalia sp. Marseille-Q2122]